MPTVCGVFGVIDCNFYTDFNLVHLHAARDRLMRAVIPSKPRSCG